MSLSIYHFACLFLLCYSLRLLLKTVLLLRFRLQFGKIGLFSISTIQYHHQRSSESPTWSLKVGKLKARIRQNKKAPQNASIVQPFITITVSDVHLQLHNLASLSTRKKPQPQSAINKQLSLMPWWYPFSLFKSIVKYISALPAQFVMAGLANYVDFEMDGFQLDIENQASFTIQNTNFSSVLFAAVDLPSSASRDLPKRSPSLHTSHQRHSIKRAQHLFKEKFFEIVISTGPIALVQLSAENKAEDIVTMPSGVRIAVSCHFSAGCVTLKDVNANTIVDTFKLNVNRLLELSKAVKALAPPKPPVEKKENKGPSFVRLLRTVSLSITDTTLDILHNKECTSVLSIKDGGLAVNMEDGVFEVEPYLKAQCTTQLVSWTIVDNTILVTKSRHLEVATVPKITINSTASLSVLIKKQYEKMDGLPEDLSKNEELIPNKQFVNISIHLDQPKIFLDISQLSTLKKLSARLHPNHDALSPNSPHKKNGGSVHNLPRTNLNVVVEYPSVYFRSMEKGVGLLSWKELSLDISGTYTAEKNRPVSIISNFSEPTVPTMSTTTGHINEGHAADPNTVQRVHSSTRPSWTNLFRRSWRPTEASTEQRASDTVQWRYKVSSRFIAQHSSLDAFVKKQHEKPLLSVKDIEVSITSNLKVNFFSSPDEIHQMVRPTWNSREQYHDLKVVIDQCVLDLCSESKKSQLEFWINDITNEIKNAFPSKKSQALPSEKKSQAMYQNILTTRFQFEINETLVILKGFDEGLKGQRPTPSGHIDNAPDKDILAHVVVSIDCFTFLFNGARVSALNRQMHRYSARFGAASSAHNSDGEGDGNEQGCTLLGSLRSSLDHIAIKRLFDGECNDEKNLAILWIPHVNIRTSIKKTNSQVVLSPSVVVKKIGIQYKVSSHYALLIATISAKLMFQEIKRKKKSKDGSSSSPVAIGKFQLQVNRTDVYIHLPEDAKLYIRIDSLRTEWIGKAGQESVPSTAIRNLTVYGVSTQEKQKWEQLLEMDTLKFLIEKSLDSSTGALSKNYQVSMSKFFFRIPFKYEICHVLDNAVNLSKAIKAIHSRLLKGIPFLQIAPMEKKEPISMPNLQLVCDLFTVQIEDDPFEAKLRSIWKSGVEEQTNRIALQNAFDLKAKTLTKKQPDEGKSDSASKENDARVTEALRGLQQHYSKSWRKRIDTTLHSEKAAYEKIRSADYRNSALPGQIDEAMDLEKESHEYADLFLIDVVQIPRYSPLFDITILNTCLDFRCPDFDLHKTREFIFDLGKGQPLDTPLSTLLPFHLDWKSGATWAQVRDYPLPMVLVPPTTPEQQSNYSWSLSGNYAVADTLGDLDATRIIKLDIANDSKKESIYTTQFPRTSTPLKFFSTVSIDVHTPGLSYLCWSIPYQPAIQDIARVFETFTKPPVDPSEKVGIWDKIRLIIHTRTKIAFAGGGDLAIVMKGSRNPYEMNEKGFGLAKVWKNDVIWLLGYENPEREFMQVISCDYAFGVPNLVDGGFIAPYILPVSIQLPKSRSSSLSSSDLDSTLSSENKKDASCFTKVALKLTGGIRMGLGCQLERSCSCDICSESTDVSPEVREEHKLTLLTFSPHYNVRMKTPDSVHEENYDAYKGFRSDFIHFSISIIKIDVANSESDVTHVIGNSMHLSPGFLDHFVSWVRLFGGAMGYPLRNGPLFPRLDTRPSKKFGKHMSTLKYKIVINPLTIGCFVKDESVEANNVTVQELGDSVGLKGFVKGFSLDIHQRKEIINVSNYKADQKQIKANWPIQEAEVQLKNIDIRAVRAQYTDGDNIETSNAGSIHNSLEPSADSDIFGNSDSDDVPDMMEGLNFQREADPESSEWVDLDDFIELNSDTPNISPIVQVIPFAFAPYFYYIRQNNRDELKTCKYLHETHDCILGTAMKTREMQVSLLQERKNNIDVQVRKHQARLYSNEMKRKQPGADKSLDEVSEQIVEKTRVLYEKRELLQKYIRETSLQSTTSSARDSNISAHSNSLIFGEDSLRHWETHLGHFKVRCIAHNPQILWNNSVRNILYHAMDLREYRRAFSYYMTSRTIKFLRDLVDATQLKEAGSEDQFVLDNEGGMDSAMVQDLIGKLLAEKNTKFYAPNETEEEESMIGESDLDDVDMSRSENINNPEMQAKSIPTNYSMKSSYLIDLLNPQISLQSDLAPDNIVLVANERIQVKGFNIVDKSELDADIGSVKHRTIASLDKLQFFVAKKEQFDSVDLLLDNHYGAKENDHWLAWIPPEALISSVNVSDQFQRIGDRISATLQYDKYNQLRLKANSGAFSRIHPFEERCDSVQLSFPKFQLTADSSQYNAVYQVATDLLIYKEPAKQERLARLREIMMAADRSSLFEITEKIVELQNTVRQLNYARDQYRHNIAFLDEKRIEEFKSIRLSLFDTLEELYLGMEAIKLIQSNQRNDYNEPKTNLKLVCSIEKLVWEMLSSGKVPLCECTLTNTNYIFISKEDHSAINTFEVDIAQVKNTSPSPVFADVLGPYFDPRKPYDFSRHKMLRCYFVTLAPVGGIPIVQHLETNLHPLRLQMTYSFGKALAYYLFPPEKRQKQSENGLPTSLSTPTLATNDFSTQFDNSQLATSTVTLPALSSDRDSSKIISSSKSTESAPTTVLGNENNESTISNKDDIEFDTFADGQTSSIQSLKQPRKPKKQNLHKHAKLKTSDDLTVMKKRASSNRTFILVKIPGARHCLSYQGPKDKNIEDLRDFAFEQPTLEFRNETWSWFELMTSIKKDFMKAALLHNSTALLKEKLLRRHPREPNNISEITLQSASVSGSRYLIGPTVKTKSILEDHDESHSEDSEGSSDEDMVSLHSTHSHEEWDSEHLEHNSKPSHIWSRLKKTKKNPLPSSSESKKSTSDNNQRRFSVGSQNTLAKGSMSRPLSTPSNHFRDDEEFTSRGRELLGKYYNGPTQWSKSNESNKK
ncbi:golgi-body localization protein domain-containing protein [Sporodiniella umbellata]|nr:golgi-body localization protein domain-containing protein [Sporodiniella umbellata]